MLNQESKFQKVCFRVNEYNWIMLSEKLGKITLRAHKYKYKGRKSDPDIQHRSELFEFDTTVKIKSKSYDTSNFTEE